MSLAAAIQVMWVLRISTWEAKRGCRTTRSNYQTTKWGLVPRGVWLKKSVCILLSMWPRFLAVQMQYGKPLAAYLNTVFPKPFFPDCLTYWLCVELIRLWAETLSHVTLKRWFRWRWTWVSVNCRNVCSSFMPTTPSHVWLVRVGDSQGAKKWGTADHPPTLDELARTLEARPIRSIEVAFSAVVREFQPSTSLQDETSLNSYSSRYPLAHSHSIL